MEKLNSGVCHFRTQSLKSYNLETVFQIITILCFANTKCSQYKIPELTKDVSGCLVQQSFPSSLPSRFPSQASFSSLFISRLMSASRRALLRRYNAIFSISNHNSNHLILHHHRWCIYVVMRVFLPYIFCSNGK